jgi:hypothetical protein
MALLSRIPYPRHSGHYEHRQVAVRNPENAGAVNRIVSGSGGSDADAKRNAIFIEERATNRAPHVLEPLFLNQRDRLSLQRRIIADGSICTVLNWLGTIGWSCAQASLKYSAAPSE